MLHIYSRPLTIILGALLLLMQYELWFAEGGIAEIHRLNSSIFAVEEQNTDLRDRNKILAADVEDLKHGDEAVEERARMDLGMIKKNELYYQVID